MKKKVIIAIVAVAVAITAVLFAGASFGGMFASTPSHSAANW